MRHKRLMGEIIAKYRRESGHTQDELGQLFGVSGPAIFKFEKAYVRPSLELWMRMAKHMEIPERRAVKIWLRDKLPEKYRDYVELGGKARSPGKGKRSSAAAARVAMAEGREEILAALAELKKPPAELIKLLKDDETWALYHPTGEEVRILLEIFAPLGVGSIELFREALRTVRDFRGSGGAVSRSRKK